MDNQPYYKSLKSFVYLILLTLGVFTSIYSYADTSKNIESTENDEIPINEFQETEQKPLPLDQLRIFTEILYRIKTTYIQEIDDETLLDNAIKGMLEGLDPHSSYLEPTDFQHLEENTSGKFGGLGIEVKMIKEGVYIVSPIDDSPAHKAGIISGDIITKIDNHDLNGIEIEKAVELMRGKPKTKVNLTILRESSKTPIKISIVRDIVKLRSVRSKILEDNYGYIRLSQFQATSGDETLKAISSLKKKAHNENLKGLILDLRNNPGGVLKAAVDITNAFISKGMIVYTKNRSGNIDLSYEADNDNPSNNIPLVVLINSGSASASEIVAGALQDHQRAVLVGMRSFGKGSVQTILPLNADNERALKLTTALYYTPLGRSIQAEGITPDIEVGQAIVTYNTNNKSQYRESDLIRHIENENDTSTNKEQDKKINSSDSEKYNNDYQLNQALNILKGMNITKNYQTNNNMINIASSKATSDTKENEK